jgi:hypothetical protein
MMAGGAFIWLKVELAEPESAKHAEIRLASLPKILRIGLSGKPSSPGAGPAYKDGKFGLWRFPPNMANLV